MYGANTRPYIVLNNRNSRFIPGLLVTDLPPITKPKIRTRAETVDGRDGDIITTLGYAAYNKELKIALTYGYNVDDVINFFNSSGTVTFSNEPDVYYNYAIYEPIDFEKLIRFKTAKVVFHVQPFKYPAFERSITHEFDGTSPRLYLIRNIGNIASRPTITVYGSGTIGFKINNIDKLRIELGDEPYITIDSQNMNAFINGRYANRLVTGDYDKIQLEPGNSQLGFTGAVSKFTIFNYSRFV